MQELTAARATKLRLKMLSGVSIIKKKVAGELAKIIPADQTI
jgi:hypothetical protein